MIAWLVFQVRIFDEHFGTTNGNIWHGMASIAGQCTYVYSFFSEFSSWSWLMFAAILFDCDASNRPNWQPVDFWTSFTAFTRRVPLVGYDCHKSDKKVSLLDFWLRKHELIFTTCRLVNVYWLYLIDSCSHSSSPRFLMFTTGQISDGLS